MALSKWKFLLCHLLCFTSKLDCIAVSRSQYLRILVEFVKEAKIQITLLILRRGAMSTPNSTNRSGFRKPLLLSQKRLRMGKNIKWNICKKPHSQKNCFPIKAQMEQKYCSSSKGDLVLDLKRYLKPSRPTQRANSGEGGHHYQRHKYKIYHLFEDYKKVLGSQTSIMANGILLG